MPKSMDEQLAELFGRDIPHKKSKKKQSKLERSSVDPERGASIHLDRLHECLRRIGDGEADHKQFVPELAYLAARQGLKVQPKEKERSAVSDIVNTILADSNSDKIDIRKQLLSAAALAFSNPLKDKLLDVLVKYGLEGTFDVCGELGKMALLESEYIANIVGKRAYLDALRCAKDEAKRTAIEAKKAQDQAAKEKATKQDALEGTFGVSTGLGKRTPRESEYIVNQLAYLDALRREKDKAKKTEDRKTKGKTAKQATIDDAISKAHQKLCFGHCPHDITVTENTIDDKKLIAAWANKPTASVTSLEDLFRLIDKNELTRLWSARTAERGALEYYKNFSDSVDDVSLTQLNPRSNAWVTHDISSNGSYYDVKNARRSFSSPSSYSEHCIPQFKHEKRTEKEVVITGILSDYLTADEIRLGRTGSTIILGEVTRSSIEELSAWVETRFNGVLEVPALNGTTFLPGWIFEFPVAHQPQRRDGIKESNAILQVASEKRFDIVVPKWLAAFTDDKKLASPYLSSLSDETIWVNLRAADTQLGISRRSLFLTILATTLTEAKNSDSLYHPRDWRNWLYAGQDVDNNTKDHPLGLIDSEQYLLNLIETLERIWDRARSHLADFRRFRLTHPAILKGQDNSGDWYTLIAYCGGWFTGPVNVKCGKSPVHIGESDSCPECHFLICPECGFCSRNCTSNTKRQAMWNNSKNPGHLEEDWWLFGEPIN